MLLFDGHLDLAMNAIEWNRDLTQPLGLIRDREAGQKDLPGRGNATVSLPELRRAGAGMVVATQIARIKHPGYSPSFAWGSAAQAWAMTQAQLAWYRAMEEKGEMIQIRDAAGLQEQLRRWDSAAPKPAEPRAGTEEEESRSVECTATTDDLRPVGYLLSLEGADSLISLDHLHRAWAYGLRAVGPAHYGPAVYANGTDASGGFPPRGKELLREMQGLGMILDVTHLCDECFWEALDMYTGPIWASHHNARALVSHNRQMSDDMFKALLERDTVVGMAFDAWMIVPGWRRGQSTPQEAGATLEKLADHIDHYCQLASDIRHVGIGSDLDGGFGSEQTPVEIGTIADVQQLGPILRRRGYSETDVEGIFSQNFLRFLQRVMTHWES